MLEEAGLVGTLRRYLSLLPKDSVELHEEIGGARFDPRVELGAYRIAQLGIRGAEHAVLRLTRDGGALVVTIEGASSDDGLMVAWADALGADLHASEGSLTARIPLH